MRNLITNGRVLIGDKLVTDTQLLLDTSGIYLINPNEAVECDQVIDAAGQLVLPGMIDLHGDAFERQMLPRPGVHFPTDMALLETDRQMLTNGITTAFHGITYSWEPGLRGRDSALEVIEHIESLNDRLGCDTKIHLRWETFNLNGVETVAGLLNNNRIHLLAFNDHINDIREDVEADGHALSKYCHRSGLNCDEFKALFDETFARGKEVPQAITKLAALASSKDIPCASHDDNSTATRHWFNEMGVHLSEFPVNKEVAKYSRELNNPIILGAPNVVRGGSHCNRLCASTAVSEELCDVLTSDYFYPSMLLAVFLLMQKHELSLEKVWPLVSINPAIAAGLYDRGQIAEGLRGDIIIIDDSHTDSPEVTASFVGGKLVYQLNRH